ncbi:MAG: arsenosugar biosynthesis radical SAM protein ArsS [Oligoflexales bacterium]|nr:arsenosugar biosynthesis radical SAM protein ArsS [Oligoflexales bacterium]
METASKWTGFSAKLKEHQITLSREAITTLQINIGKLCNQACLHCHVEAGPNKKRENMNRETVDKLIELLKNSPETNTVDITGGAPELNPHFRHLVENCRALGKEVIDRCNLTVLFEKGQEDTAQFLASSGVKVVASLPCYSKENVEKQRGDGVFDKSIKGLQQLNELGYGKEGTGLSLDLVYNPGGAFLPPPQKGLEVEYKQKLQEDFGISFNQLYVITNMPIKRFLFDLKRSKQYDNYMKLLSDNFNVKAVPALMCTNLISISWDGKLYDCDFNQMLELPTGAKAKTIHELSSLSELIGAKVVIADHCLGCTAGAGSSCTGALGNSK